MRPRDIVRSDFPTARKGFDRRAVDHHLRTVAAEMAELLDRLGRREAAQSSEASRRVAGIVEAVEQQAAEIETEARAEAERILGEARQEAGRIVEEARREGAGHVEEVRTRVGQLAEAAAALERSLGEELRGSLERAVEDLGRLRSETGALTAADAQLLDDHGEDSDEREAGAEPGLVFDEEEDEVQAVTAAGRTVEYEPVFEGEEGEVEEEEIDPSVEVARLAAINMAQSDTPREEAAQRLSEEFDLDDVDSVLDDAYARTDA